jgi:scyllo-inositol 2-dehydrogenase (NADP+)
MNSPNTIHEVATMPADKPVRVAIIGYGLAGAVFHAPLVAATPDMSVAAIVTNNPARVKQAHEDFPNATILPTADRLWESSKDIDLVVIGTPNIQHVPLGLASMRAGIPVVIDKPLAATVDDARQLISCQQETGVPFTVFQNRRWDGDFLTIRQLMTAGLLGDIIRIESRFDRYRLVPNANAWREHSSPGEAGGLLYDLGSHLIDQVIVLFGRPTRVYAELAMRRPGAAVDDDTFVALHFPSGIDAHLWMSVVAPQPGPRFRVTGLLGTYEKHGLDPQEPDLRDGMRPGDPNWGEEDSSDWGTLVTERDGLHIESKVKTLPGTYEIFYAQVRDALREGVPWPVDPTSVIDALRVIEAAQQSAREHSVVTLEW